MRFKKLFFKCECGRSPARIRDVGLTAEHELVVRWRCAGCKRQMYVVKSLADCWRECLPEGYGQQVPEAEERTTAADIQFLHSLGVQFPEGVDC